MRSASPALKALLATRVFVKADLYTITLKGGVVVRWTNADQSLSYGGFTFVPGPLIERGSISDVMGLEVSELEVTLNETELEASKINGVKLIEFIRKRGLDGANLKLERAFMGQWSTSNNSLTEVVGTVLRFFGKITSVEGIKGSEAKIRVSSWTVYLNTNAPPDVYQAGCLNTVYDSKCGLPESSYRQTFTIASGSTTSTLKSTVVPAANAFIQGRVVFDNGPNAGLSRTIRLTSGSDWQIIPPLPSAPVAGNTFKASLGCDLTKATCASRFNNELRFRGTPFVPVPETAI